MVGERLVVDRHADSKRARTDKDHEAARRREATCRERQGSTEAQTARALRLHPQMVAKWSARLHFERRRSQRHSRATVCLTPSNQASRGCWTPTRTVRCKSSSVYARTVTVEA